MRIKAVRFSHVFFFIFFFKQVNMQVKSYRKIINGEMLRYASRTVLSLLYHSNLPNNYNFSLIKNNTFYFLCLHLKVWKTTFMVEWATSCYPLCYIRDNIWAIEHIELYMVVSFTFSLKVTKTKHNAACHVTEIPPRVIASIFNA